MSDISGAPRNLPTSRICSPGHVRVKRTSPTSVNLTWEEPYSWCHLCPDALGFEVSGDGIDTVRVTHPPCEVTGLRTDGGQIVLAIIAKAAGGITSTPTFVEIVDVTPPTVPMDFNALEVTRHSVTLGWTASTDDVAVRGYALRRNGSWIQNVLTGTSVRVAGLMPGTTCTFSVAAYDTSTHFSAYTDCIVTTLADTTPPTLPSNLKFLHQSILTRGTLYWTQSTDDEGMDSYEIAVNQTVIHTVPHDPGSGYRHQAIGGLQHGVTYLISIRAKDIHQNYSEAAQLLVTPGSDWTLPTPPGNVRVVLFSDGVVLAWDPSEDNAIVTYWVALNGRSWPALIPVFMLPGLSPDTTYSVKITAVDSSGNTSEPTDFVFTTLRRRG